MTASDSGSRASRAPLADIRIDDSAWPLLRVAYPRSYTREQMGEHLRALERFVDRRQQFTILFDLSDTRPLDAGERADFAQFLKRKHAELDRYCIAACIVTTSTVHRGVLTALSWLARMPFEVATRATRTEGEKWLREQAARSRPEQ